MKKKLLIGLAVVVLLIGGAAAYLLGGALLPAEHVEVGIALEEKAPVDMELANEAGETATLASAMGDKGMVLYLVRSADWCPFCKAQMKDVMANQAPLSERGYAIASLSYDAPEVLAMFKQGEEISYTMLSDTDSKLIDAMGLRDPEYAEGHFAYGVPRASILVLAPDGTVKAKFVSADYKSRPSNEDVIEMVDSVS